MMARPIRITQDPLIRKREYQYVLGFAAIMFLLGMWWGHVGDFDTEQALKALGYMISILGSIFFYMWVAYKKIGYEQRHFLQGFKLWFMSLLFAPWVFGLAAM